MADKTVRKITSWLEVYQVETKRELQPVYEALNKEEYTCMWIDTELLQVLALKKVCERPTTIARLRRYNNK